MYAFTTILLHLSSKVKRQRRKSEEATTSNSNSQIENPMANRPPAPLPKPQTDQHDEVIYYEPETPRRGSVDSLELPSNDSGPNISLNKGQQSSRPGRVIPRPPSPSHAINTREGSLGDTQPLTLSKEIKASLTCMGSYESLPRSAPEVAIPQRVEQLTVANTTSATESSQQHSTERTMNCENSKLESAEISALSEDQDIDSASGHASKIPQKICISPSDTPVSSPVVRGEQGLLRIQNKSYVKDTICDKPTSAVSADTANHSSYSNLPPPFTQQRQKTAESDVYITPCELSVDIDNLSPVVKAAQEPPGKQNESRAANHLLYSNLPPQPPPRPQVTAESDACMKPCELPSESVDTGELRSPESNPYLECFP